uniref:CSD domain-containing protein n=1 Tax=Helicotheca tamesis TaxID=374047 RepID=A0A7S2I025_9STRA|mmetsp:Transcript_4034/g.5459  ORF Transcript_4034/g.5459 Transcript_4034/m.5459 type:complete len:279 (+) Transcript_4034:104-940(+)
MSEEKIQGTVKWFSNKKGYGFLTPNEGSPVDVEDVFVHQSSIHSEGYRSLDQGWVVEFTIGHDEDGKMKAENVTSVGGGPCTGPRHHRSRGHHPRHRDNGDEDGGNEDSGEHKGRRRTGRGRGGPRNSRGPPQPHWHNVLDDGVKESLQTKGIHTATGTIDVSVGTARVKLGTRGYASMATSDARLAEGSFACGEEGHVTLEWKRCIIFDMGAAEWKLIDETSTDLLASLNLADDNVTAVGQDETAATLWGDGPTDPRTALEENDFEMRRVVLTPRKR